MVSDDHAGLRAARRAVLPSVPWQRRQAHPQQNAGKYVTRLDDREPVARTIRAIFIAIDSAEAREKLRGAIVHWQRVHPMLAKWAEDNLAEGCAGFGLPESLRVRMRATNGLERLNEEIKRRTPVATLFPKPESCSQLVSALLSEHDEEWLSRKVYLTMKPESTEKWSSQNQQLIHNPDTSNRKKFRESTEKLLLYHAVPRRSMDNHLLLAAFGQKQSVADDRDQ